jgi:hypothetical protein
METIKPLLWKKLHCTEKSWHTSCRTADPTKDSFHDWPLVESGTGIWEVFSHSDPRVYGICTQHLLPFWESLMSGRASITYQQTGCLCDQSQSNPGPPAAIPCRQHCSSCHKPLLGVLSASWVGGEKSRSSGLVFFELHPRAFPFADFVLCPFPVITLSNVYSYVLSAVSLASHKTIVLGTLTCT